MSTNFDKVTELYSDQMDDARDDNNSLGKTVYDCSLAEGILLMAILKELQSIRKTLENSRA
jgi:hypothetical protein